MKKAILTFTFFIVVIATHAQVKMHSDGRITFQTVANTTTQGISFGPTPDCNATFNGNVYFNKGGIFNKKAPNYGWMNCSRADSAFARFQELVDLTIKYGRAEASPMLRSSMLEELCRFRELYCKAYLERNLCELAAFNRYLDHFAQVL